MKTVRPGPRVAEYRGERYHCCSEAKAPKTKGAGDRMSPAPSATAPPQSGQVLLLAGGVEDLLDDGLVFR